MLRTPNNCPYAHSKVVLLYQLTYKHEEVGGTVYNNRKAESVNNITSSNIIFMKYNILLLCHVSQLGIFNMHRINAYRL